MALGWPSVEWGLAHISSRELSEWLVFDAIEPIGDRRLDLLFAYLMTFQANMNRPKDEKALEISDFLLDFWANEPGEHEPQSLEEQRSIIEMMKLVFERSR